MGSSRGPAAGIDGRAERAVDGLVRERDLSDVVGPGLSQEGGVRDSTDGADVGAKIRYAFHTSSPTKIASDNQRGIRIRPVGLPGPGVDGVGPLPGGAGDLGVLLGPVTGVRPHSCRPSRRRQGACP